MKLITHKVELFEMTLIAGLGKTVFKLYYLQFPKALPFILARPLDILVPENEPVDLDKIMANEIPPFCADFFLQGHSLRSTKIWQIKKINKSVLPVEDYHMPYCKMYAFGNPVFDDYQNVEPQNIQFWIQDENLKTLDSRLFPFEKISHLPYDNYIGIGAFREGLSLVWAVESGVSTEDIILNSGLDPHLSMSNPFAWGYLHLKNFRHVEKDFWYKPL